MPLHQPYTCLWVNNQAEEMANFYCSVFSNATIVANNGFMVRLHINGALLVLLNGNNNMQLNDTFSLVIECETQEEIDIYWEALINNGGKEKACGWLQDKYGVSWQIVPSILGKLMSNPNTIEAISPIFMKMKKIVIADLENPLPTIQ
jgi:predicted 3-demethylubiquinone-9 3-methyltransferase (glyoxalase superfamily)